MRNTSALRFTNGSAQAVTAAAASSINNLGSFTVAMWVDLTTVAPAAQRNFFGKSTGNSRVVGFINATTISVQYGSSVSAPTATATTTNCPGVAANQPVFIVFVVDAGVGVPKLYTGSPCIPASEPSAYSAQTTGSTTGHDDSASAWNFANGGTVGTTNTLHGNVLSIQVLNRIPRDLAEVREMQYDPWNPTRSGCVLSWRVGASGELVVLDESGRGNHGAVAGAPPLVVDPLPFVRRDQPSMGRWKRALFAPSGTGTLTATLGAATLSGTGALAISGALTTTLSAAALSATGALPISGAVTSTLAAATLAGTGTLPITGSATVTLAAATVSASGTIGSFATLAVTLDAATLTATGTLPIAGAAAANLASATLAGVGTLPIVGGATVTLTSATLSASGVSTGGTVLFPPDRFTTSQRQPRRQRRVAFDGAFGVRMSGAQDGRKLFDLVEGTTAQLDPFRLYIEDAPINLTGITVACIVRDVNGDLVTIASGQIEVDPDQSWNATTETGGRGQVYLTPTAGQFSAALSPYRIRWQLTDGAGDVQFVPDAIADRFLVFKP